MRRLGLLFGLLLLMVPLVSAQSQPTDVAVSCPAATLTTVTGPPGTVEPNYQIAVQSIDTGEIAYATADSEGGFSVEMTILPGMPLHVYSARSITQTMRSARELPPGRAVLLNTPASSSIATGGQLAYGSGTWLASGDVIASDGAINATLDVTFIAPAANLDLPFTLVGDLGLLPLTDSSGVPFAPANADWSPVQTASGLPILGAPADTIPVAVAITDETCVDAENGLMTFSLNFQGVMPDLPDGLYQWTFDGRIAVADSVALDWYANRLLGTSGQGPESTSHTALPATVNIGDVQPNVPLAIAGYPSDDAPLAMLHGVNYEPDVWVQPPGEMAIEPAFLTPWQALLGQVTSLQFDLLASDGSVVLSLPQTSQMRIEWDGQHYIVAAEDPLYTPLLEIDGSHKLSGQLDLKLADTSLTATYTHDLVIAQPLHIVPSVLPGTPFVMGDAFSPGLYSQPALDMLNGQSEITLTVHPLSGEPQNETWSLPLKYGASISSDTFTFDQPGHYIVDYALSGLGTDGRLWAGSLRTAGIIAQPGNHAQGQRGVVGYEGQQQSWFDMAVFPADDPNVAPIIYPPVFSGDVAYLPDEADVGVLPYLTAPDASPNAFALFSAVRPDVRLRQAVMRPNSELPNLIWRNDDLLDGQTGAGLSGNREGDLALLFGGVVDADEVEGYASLAVITDDDDTVRVLPPFQQPITNTGDSLLFLPGSLRPGQIVPLGSQIPVSGQFAPPLPAKLYIYAISPTDMQQPIEAQANDYGYLYADALHFDEPGIWQIAAEASFVGQTSAALVELPSVGAVPGVEQTYAIYVLPDDALQLTGTQAQVAPGNPVVLSVDVPEGWTDVSAHVTVATASQQLDAQSADVTNLRYSYRYDPNQLSRTIPNLEPNGTGSGPAASDAVWVTIVLTATDASGQPAYGYRQFTVLHDRVE